MFLLQCFLNINNYNKTRFGFDQKKRANHKALQHYLAVHFMFVCCEVRLLSPFLNGLLIESESEFFPLVSLTDRTTLPSRRTVRRLKKIIKQHRTCPAHLKKHISVYIFSMPTKVEIKHFLCQRLNFQFHLSRH